MLTQKKSAGFTLVELAIVMTIIGLLIGGILKGQQLMRNARITSTIAQVRAYEAAVTTFRDKYDAIPGDIVGASRRIPGCTAACDPDVIANALTAGDSIVGVQAWATGGWAAQSGAAPAMLAGQSETETVLFWTHLLLSDLISGVTNEALTGGAAAWGSTHPGARIAGGFMIGNGDGAPTAGSPAAIGPSGMILVLANSPSQALTNAAGTQVLIPTEAAQIDRKTDDGLATSGYTHAYGGPNCFANAGSYLESTTATDCGLIFRIQG